MPGASKSLRQQVIELEELGRKFGLSETDVKRCLESALQANPVTSTRAGNQKLAKEKRSGRNAGVAGNIKLQSRQVGATSTEDIHKSSRTQCCKWVWIAVFCVIGCSCALAASTQCRSVRRIIALYFFDVMRLIRRETLGLHSKYNVSYYYDEPCLVKNPLFMEPDVTECLSCHGMTAVKLHKGKTGSLYLKELSQPLLLKKHLARAVGWGEVVGVVEDVAARLDVPSLRWHTSLPWMSSILDLRRPDFEEKVGTSPDFYLQWKCPSLAVGHRVRQLFPRSGFLSRKLEMSLDKIIIMHGPQAKPFYLDRAMAGFVVYIQGSGRTRVHLKPPDKCHKECLLLDVVMEEGDMLVYLMDTFKAEVIPQGEGIHVGYLTYIM